MTDGKIGELLDLVAELFVYCCYVISCHKVTSFLAVSSVAGTWIWLLRLGNSKVQKLPPSLPSLPILGSLPFMALTGKQDHLHYQQLAEKYGNIYSFWLGKKLAVVLSGYETIRTALLDQAVAMAGRSAVDGHITNFLNPQNLGLIEATFTPRFKEERRISLTILKNFGLGRKTMEYHIQHHVNDLVAHLQTLEGRPNDLKDVVTVCVSNVLSDVLLGKHFQISNCNEVKTLLESVGVIKTLMGKKILMDRAPILAYFPVLKESKTLLVYHYQLIYDYMKAIVMEHEDAYYAGKQEDFVDAFIGRMGPKYTRENLIFIIRDLFMAGAETTATTLQWMLLYMANNGDVQKRVQEELDRNVGRSRPVTLDDKCHLPYVEAVVQESQRLSCLLAGVPHLSLAETELCGYHIPENTIVLINLWSVLRDPELWPDPDVFRPERFLNVDGRALHKPELIIFSLGRRSCLGESLARQELFLFFCGVMQHFTIRTPEGVDKLDETSQTFFPRAPQPFQVVAEPRTAIESVTGT